MYLITFYDCLYTVIAILKKLRKRGYGLFPQKAILENLSFVLDPCLFVYFKILTARDEVG